MRVLLDNCVDVRFASLLPQHEVKHARGLGWQDLSNGHLLASAESAGFAVMITTDKNIRFQQNFKNRLIALVTLAPRFTAFVHLAPLADQVNEALTQGVAPGTSLVITSDQAD